MSTPPTGTGVTPPTPPLPPSPPADALEAANRLMKLHHAAESTLGSHGSKDDTIRGAAKRVNNHRTGSMDDPESWGNLSDQSYRFQFLYAGAVGEQIDAKTKPLEDKTKQDVTTLGVDPDHAMILDHPKGMGAYMGVSWDETAGVWALNRIPDPKMQGRSNLVAADPHDTNVATRIGGALDQAVKDTIKNLKNEMEEIKKTDPNGTTDAYKERDKKLNELEDLQNNKKKSFRQMAITSTEVRKKVSRRFTERENRDWLVGQTMSSRHNEENPDNLLFLNTLNRLAGTNFQSTSIRVMLGFEHAGCKARKEGILDPDTGEYKAYSHVDDIPLYNDEGIQRAAGVFNVQYYDELLRVGTPRILMQMETDGAGNVMKFNTAGVQDANGKPRPNLYDKSGKKLPYDVNGQPDPNGKPRPDKTTDGKCQWETDAAGNVIYDPMEADDLADFIKKHPFPMGTLPGKFPQHSVQFLMATLAQNLAMGGTGFWGFDPNTPAGLNPFKDTKGFEAGMAKMKDADKEAFKLLVASTWKAQLALEQNRVQENIIKPAIYHEYARANEKFAAERILRKGNYDPGHIISDTEINDLLAKAGNNPKSPEGKKLEKMLKTPLNGKEKALALAAYNKRPAAVRTKWEQETVYKEHGDGTQLEKLGKGPQLQINNSAQPTPPPVTASVSGQPDDEISLITSTSGGGGPPAPDDEDDDADDQFAGPSDDSNNAAAVGVNIQKNLRNKVQEQQKDKQAAIDELNTFVHQTEPDEYGNYTTYITQTFGNDVPTMLAKLKKKEEDGDPQMLVFDKGGKNCEIVPANESVKNQREANAKGDIDIDYVMDHFVDDNTSENDKTDIRNSLKKLKTAGLLSGLAMSLNGKQNTANPLRVAKSKNPSAYGVEALNISSEGTALQTRFKKKWESSPPPTREDFHTARKNTKNKTANKI